MQDNINLNFQNKYFEYYYIRIFKLSIYVQFYI